MYKKILGIMALVFSMGMSQSVLADSTSCGEGLKSMLQSLNLTDAQKEKIKPMVEQQKTAMKDLHTQLHDVDTQIDKQLSTTPVDQSALEGLVDKKGQLIGSMIKSKLMIRAQMFTILTAEQKAKLQQMFKQVEDKMAAKFKHCNQDS